MTEQALPRQFGSANRINRERPAYQEGALRGLSQFLLRVLQCHVQHIADEEVRAREVWNGKLWLESQLASAQKVEAELRAWNAEIQNARNWCEEQRQNWEQTATWYKSCFEQAEQTIAALKQDLAELKSRHAAE